MRQRYLFPGLERHAAGATRCTAGLAGADHPEPVTGPLEGGADPKPGRGYGDAAGGTGRVHPRPSGTGAGGGGAGFGYAFNDTWSLQPSLFLTSKGAKKDGNSINAMYLELPVMAAARFNVADNTNLVVNAGPYFACGIAGKTKFDLGNDTERKVDTFGDDALKRFDAGLGVGVALEFGRIIAGLDGQFGLVDVQKFGNPKNMNFSIVVGYKF